MNRSILLTLVGVAIGVCVAVPIGIAAFGNSFNVILPTAIGGGANEIMLEVIAKTMGIHPGKNTSKAKG